MNVHAMRAIYLFEMARTRRTLLQSLVAPVLSTSLYFIVFGAAIGSRMSQVGGVSYGAFIVPGLIMLGLLTQSISNASFGIYFPRFVGTIYELLSAPISPVEIVIAYVGAAATKSIGLGLITLATATLFVTLRIDHPFWMVPLLIITPLTFLGGSFYSIDMLPPFWRAVTLVNPVVYLVSGFRWSFYSVSDVSVGVSLGMTLVFLSLCLAIVVWMFKTGYRLKT